MTTTSTSTSRSAAPRPKLLHAVPFVAVLVIVATSLLLGDQVPDQITTHWGLNGVADGTLPHELLIVADGFLALLAGYGLLALARRAREQTTARGAASAALGLATGIAGLHWTALASNIGPPPGAATLSPVGITLTLVAVFAMAAVGWRFGPDGDGGAPEELVIDELAIEPGEAVIWSGGATAGRAFWILPAAAIALGLGLLVTGEPAAATIVLVSAALVMSMLRVRGSVGPAGMRIRFGPFGLLSWTVPLADIVAVRAEQVDPMRFGGWGYRVLPGARAIVVHCGPGVRLERRDAPDLVITLDDAPVAAGVLRAHLDATTTGV